MCTHAQAACIYAICYILHAHTEKKQDMQHVSDVAEFWDGQEIWRNEYMMCEGYYHKLTPSSTHI